jgi:hypothetical protein
MTPSHKVVVRQKKQESKGKVQEGIHVAHFNEKKRKAKKLLYSSFSFSRGRGWVG